jgi:uncharacterized membrane protein YdjX (TVP38/TMEM64 family)/rhodanese-related sulfurtransferase/sulfur relay (sulfurtransferase) complex TusBCD TusD component (DsrE family)
MSRQNLARLAAGAAIVAAIALAVIYRDRVDFAALQAWIAGLGVVAPLVFVAIYALGAVLFFPGSVLTLAGGAVFGPVWGTLYNLTGATIGATLAFLVARYLAQDWVTRRAGGKLKQLLEGVEAEGWKFVAFTRLVPLFPFNLLNYALGLTRIRLWHYIAATFVFMLPGAIAYTYLGYAGREAVAGAEGMIQKGLLALALLALVAFLPRLVKRLRAPAGNPGEGLTAADLKQRLAKGETIKVLDVRTAKDYAGSLGSIPGSVNIPLDELPKRLAELEADRDRPIAVVCRTNKMSGKAVQQLREKGFKQALLVTDGMVGWSGGKSTPGSGECGDVPIPKPINPGSTNQKIATIVIQNAPYKPDNKAWHALRFAGAALAEDMVVRVHLLDEGVGLARRGQQVPPGAADLEKLLAELMEYGLEVRACTMSMGDCHLDESAVLPGVEKGSMKSLAAWIKESDVVLTF